MYLPDFEDRSGKSTIYKVEGLSELSHMNESFCPQVELLFHLGLSNSSLKTL